MPTLALDRPAATTAPVFLSAPGELSPAPGSVDADPLAEAVERQTRAALAAVRDTDPQTWLFLERARYLADGTCDPYAELMLRRAGFLTAA